ncbi:Beta-TrCP [Drechslerella dactyloides]|uniref:Beta-TrCP n=1 Tax=Drechslerella dactyloides TaxID=74499 RepID=A0AAD6IWI4_DREDA|nr:Beta-TrCP [Drechslerella dactyloides]
MSADGDPLSDRYSPIASPDRHPDFQSTSAFPTISTAAFSSSSSSSASASSSAAAAAADPPSVLSRQSSLPRPDPGPSLKRPGSPLLRKTHSFKLDEGYGEGAEESQSFQETHCESQDAAHDDYRPPDSPSGAAEVRVPRWMMDLSDDVRKELAYKLVRSLPTSAIASIVERLIPVLHLDFITLLPSELSLQILSYLPPKSLLNASLASRTWRKFAMEPRLWKGLYRAEGWSLNDEEAFEFEREMRGESKRKLQQEAELFMRTRFVGYNGGSSSTDNMSTAATMGSEPRSMSSFSTQQHTPPASFQSSHTTPDEEDMYPSPFVPQRTNPILMAASSADPANITSITTYGLTHPRLNWAFVFRNRKKLEENWRTNKYTSFQMPDPAFAHEGHSECIYTIQHSAKYLLSGSRDRSIKIWNIHSRRLVKSLTGHEGSVLCLQFDDSAHEDVIFSGSSDTNVIVWRFSTGERLRTITKAHSESVLNLRFNQKYVVTCSKDKCVKVWSRAGLQFGDGEYEAAVRQIQLGNNRLIDPSQLPHYIQMTGHARPTKDLPPLTLIHTLVGHNAAVNAIQLNGDEVVSASGDRLIKLWNLKTGYCEKTYVGHKKGIACIQYDGVKIVSGSSDKSIRVWDKASQAEIARLEGHTGLVRTVQAGGPRNARIVSGGYDETIRIWRREDENGELDDGENPGIFGSLRDGVSWRTTGILRHVNEAPPARSHHHLAQAAAAAAAANAAVMQQPPPPPPPPPQPNPPAAIAPPNPANPALNAAQNAFINVNTHVANNAAPAPPPQPHPHPHPVAHPHPPPPQFNVAPIPPANVQQFLPQPWNPQNHNLAAPAAAAQNQNKVFKLQFDARFVWCCSQDMRIVGWDFAANDPDIIEASRFF